MKINWRQDIVYATTMGVEGCALYVLLVLLNEQVTDGRLTILQFLLLFPLVFVFNKMLQWWRWPRALSYPINGLLWIIGMLIMVKTQLFSDLSFADPTWVLAVPQAITKLLYAFEPQLLVLVASAISWWLGWHLAHLRVGFATSLSEFQFGLAIMLIVFFIASQLSVPMDNAIPLTLIFFTFALLGMSIAHAQEETSWLSGLHGHWPGLLLVSIGLILVLGLAISAVVTPDLIQLILYALNWLLDQIMKVVAFLMSLLPQPGPMEPMPGMNMTAGEPSEEFKMWTIPEPVLSGLRLGWTILTAGLILLALWRISSQIFGWLRRRMAAMAGAEVEPIPGGLADILGFLKRILLKLLGFKLPVRRQKKPEPHEIASIRQIYRQFLKWAAAHGWSRPASQTPYEYLYTLEEQLPEYTDALHFITKHYVNARYGLSSPSLEELHQLKQSWHRISQYRFTKPEKEAHKSA